MTERTPAGGDRSEIILLDADGVQVDSPSDAVEAVVREYAGDVMIRRTYMSPAALPPTWQPAGEVRGEPDAADFAKNTWDIYYTQDGIVTLANTLDGLFKAMDVEQAPDDIKQALLIAMLKLPVWTAAPTELKQDVSHWLARH